MIAIMSHAHRLTTSRMQITIPDQLSCPEPTAIYHNCALRERFCQIRDGALCNLPPLRLKFLYQVIEEDMRINDGSLKNIAICIPRWQLFFVSMTKAIHGCHPPGICAYDGLKL